MTATEVAPCQLDAYNAHDLVAFPATYSKNADLTSLASANRPVIGEGAIAELYGTKVFSVAGHRAELPGRMAFGNKVADLETVFGLGPEPFEVIAVHEVNDHLIERVWFLSAA